MASLQWDRLLETCCRSNATDLLLIPGSPPLIRLDELWRSLQVNATHLEEIRALATELLGANPRGRADGYAFSSFRFGKSDRFRAMAIGFPDTTALVVSRHPYPPESGSFVAVNPAAPLVPQSPKHGRSDPPASPG
jgi:Tfp pilus assembly pilus retraction ATPase PilT